ncbi:unnamed protein product [Vitrella brassicaformis CCMP3155]|uniref:Uncharacterized protein n=1 Tax=Vitrella brassicaformis (strain CCMP3155) TaxID=1169540 RepID=A0A0G4EVK0_VITBC|nr:unnamed protein product [Vitrella brassicaformis CCMP3155]|eukprot:CEM02308.1 unnamed protein product [Vitrella brassicaformis CCMP3155]
MQRRHAPIPPDEARQPWTASACLPFGHEDDLRNAQETRAPYNRLKSASLRDGGSADEDKNTAIGRPQMP